MYRLRGRPIDGLAVAAFGAGVLSALLLPRLMLGALCAGMLVLAGCLLSKQHNKGG